MLNPNGVIFSTVTQFVEQVGRRKVWKYGDLDQMTCIWNGPVAGALNFKPQVGAKHPDYPLMFCTDSEIADQAALIAEVHATYAGIIQTKGQSPYYTPPVVTLSPVQGSRDFIRGWSYVSGSTANDVFGDGSVIQYTPLYTGGTQTTTIRYIGTQCQMRYQAYPSPPHGGHYSGLGLGKVNWTILSETFGPQMVSLKDASYQDMQQLLREIPPVPPLYAAYLGTSAEQRGNWHTVTETYGPTF